MWSDATARRAIVFAGCLGMIYTQLTMSPAATEYARSLGATGWHIGLLGALPTLTLLTQFLAAVLANRLRYRRRLWMPVALIERLLFLPAAAVMLWPAGTTDSTRLWLFVGLTAANHALLNFCTPLWLSWMGDYLPREGLSRFWGVRHNAMQWAAAGSLMAGALWLRRTGWDFASAFGCLLIAGAVCGVIDILCFSRVYEPPVTPAPEPRWRDIFAAPFRDAVFRRFIAYQCFWNLAVMTASPFISLYLLREKGIPADKLLLLWAFSWVGGAVLSKRLGRLVEQYGNKPMMNLCATFKSVNIVALLLMPTDAQLAFWMLVPIFMFDSLLNAGIAIAQNGFLLKNSPAGNRTMFVAAGTALAGLVGGVTSIAVGAAVAISDGSTLRLGSVVWGPIEVAFAASIVLRIVAAYFGRYVIENQSQSTATEVFVQMIGVTPMRVLRFPLGFYRTIIAEEKPAAAPRIAPLPRERMKVA